MTYVPGRATVSEDFFFPLCFKSWLVPEPEAKPGLLWGLYVLCYRDLGYRGQRAGQAITIPGANLQKNWSLWQSQAKELPTLPATVI